MTSASREVVMQTATKQREQRKELMLLARQSAMPTASPPTTSPPTSLSTLGGKGDANGGGDVNGATGSDKGGRRNYDDNDSDAPPAKRFRSFSHDASLESIGSERGPREALETRRWSQPTQSASTSSGVGLVARRSGTTGSPSALQKRNKLLAEKLAAPPMAGK